MERSLYLRKYLLPGAFLVLGITFWTLSFFPRNPSFEAFTEQLLQHELSDNLLNLHYTLANPEEAGISRPSRAFQSLSKKSFQDRLSYLNNRQKLLHRFQKQDLTKENQMTARILDWWINGQREANTFYYYQEPLGPSLGIQAQLPVLLAEYAFRKEEDIEDYLFLLSSLPDYFNELTLFEREKSAQGLFMNDDILNRVLDQCRAFLSESSPHFLDSTFQERLKSCLFLSEEQKERLILRNQNCLKQFVFPAYQQLCTAMERLKGTGKNTGGLCQFPAGCDYYTYLLRYSVGTDRSIEDICGLLEDQMETDYEIIFEAIQAGADLNRISKRTPSFQNPEQLLSELELRIRDDFPQAPDTLWQVKSIPPALRAYSSPAFYLVPAIDQPQQNIIYINPSYQPDRTELITTLAHEGYPGHLYQNCFERTCDPIRTLVYAGGYTEGWGLYSEFYAYDFLGYTKEEAALLRAFASLNYAVCANLDLFIHTEGFTEEDCVRYLASFGITDPSQIHELYLNILEEPSNYLKYYLGYLEICKLKESAMTHSPNLSVSDFHRWFLTAGPAPFSILQDDLKTSKISSDLFQGSHQNFQLSVFQTVHDGLDHFPVKLRMPLIGSLTLLCQRKENYPLIL